MAAQLIRMSGLLRRDEPSCSAVAISSLPVPLSPVISTVEGVSATFSMILKISCICGDWPTIAARARPSTRTLRCAMSGLLEFTARRISIPPTFGITKSVITMSAPLFWNSARPCSPSAATVTSYPVRRSMVASTLRRLASSSTTSTLAMHRRLYQMTPGGANHRPALLPLHRRLARRRSLAWDLLPAELEWPARERITQTNRCRAGASAAAGGLFCAERGKGCQRAIRILRRRRNPPFAHRWPHSRERFCPLPRQLSLRGGIQGGNPDSQRVAEPVRRRSALRLFHPCLCRAGWAAGAGGCRSRCRCGVRHSIRPDLPHGCGGSGGLPSAHRVDRTGLSRRRARAHHSARSDPLSRRRPFGDVRLVSGDLERPRPHIYLLLRPG